MELKNKQFIEFWNKCQKFVDEISAEYQYPTNISHLLYFIVPAFILQYGIRQEKLIFKIFKSIPILIDDHHDEIHQASFSRTLKRSGERYVTEKCIYLYHYDQISFMQLLDNLIHEFNHAVNSIKKEVLWDSELVLVRTGLTYFRYDVKTLKPIDRQKEVLLEEIINTRQTEKIIEQIASFGKYTISDTVFINVLYAIRKEVSAGYQSGAYYLQTSVCRKLLENRTFISTLERLRFQGEVSDLDYWFDQIAGVEGSFQRFNDLLALTMKLEENLSTTKWFRKRKLRKISKSAQELFHIIDCFHQNCNFK